uniref:Uncharacterized protein n=1 Tax=Drosophila melanogaster TaxID=7227 RepID=A0A2U8U1T7_DROME|nr:uncharacterized protein Dmel_CG46335 [Drosophila melanogaster]AWM95314.1 uncharacterized protein Dmel_CG46335 [Drosophila melanogaster]|eukprot:NP_001350865.1 uncharacterized protein Dmel_CG46335 [Drosophila melanogaster]
MNFPKQTTTADRINILKSVNKYG